MSSKWYPFIDSGRCSGCIACIEYCERGVLEEVDKKAHVKSKDKGAQKRAGSLAGGNPA